MVSMIFSPKRYKRYKVLGPIFYLKSGYKNFLIEVWNNFLLLKSGLKKYNFYKVIWYGIKMSYELEKNEFMGH